MDKKPVTVIYHRSDFDGIFCREIARRFLPGAELIGWEYGDPVPVVPHGHRLYLLDISVEGLMQHPGLIWIDHHKTAFEKYPPTIPGYQVDGVAACRLAWQWFSNLAAGSIPTPRKELFIDRKVSEPLAVRLAGEYDVWDKRDPRAELFQHGLRTQELEEVHWDWLLNPASERDAGMGVETFVQQLLRQGAVVQFAKTNENASVIKNNGFDLKWEGRLLLACNHGLYNSHLFTAGIRPEHDGLLGFCWRGPRAQWSVSLYGVPGKPDVDLSVIATKYGGGGHKQACGFSCAQLPFPLGPAAKETDSSHAN